MKMQQPLRTVMIGLLIVAAGAWALGEAATAQNDYPNASILASAEWLNANQQDKDVVIVDVREDEHFHGKVIPGAIRMPWGQFRTTDPVTGVSGVFIGVNEAQKLLGEHGISRGDTIVLYDSVERDGGATASYVFWVLDLLGHTNVKVLNGGIDAWQRQGFGVADEPSKQEAVLYQAPPEEIKSTSIISGDDLYERLGDAYFQVLDVRSREEYLGEAPNVDWQGRTLKLGHVPGAYNVNYISNWVDPETKLMKPYAELQKLYPGLDPQRAVVTYCHTARRSSFSYFSLRLMGFKDVRLYDYSWNHWGKKNLYYPVEQTEHVLSGPLPGASGQSRSRGTRVQQQTQSSAPSSNGERGGYISCGG